MPIRVLIADDSSFICKRIQEILQEEPGFQVVGVARNGSEAVKMAATLQPDVMTMDIEMPVMDGITAVKKIMSANPLPILMFSSFTHIGAQATFEALEAGAMDFLPKQLEEINSDREIAKRLLRHKVRTVALHAQKVKVQSIQSNPALENPKPFSSQQGENSGESFKKSIRLLVIIASTGGPVAIQKILSTIPQTCFVPILLLQHMPSSFTGGFAERLNQRNQIKVSEAVEGDLLEPGLALLAPGGKQMTVSTLNGKKRILLRDKTAEEIYAPCADITLESVAQQYKNKALTVVLTGMGSDGKAGAEKIKLAGSKVWAQDQASCTIYGMPKAIVDANLADSIDSLDEICAKLGKIL